LIGQVAEPLTDPYYFRLKGISTRIFLIDLEFFKKHKLTLTHPGVRALIKASIRKHPTYDLPEDILSAYMHSWGLERIDFLGTGKGLWSLHPPYRNELFYNSLPELIARVNENNLHPSQDGFYDIVDEVCDWTDAKEKLKKNRWWKKMFST
jgi:hypothetical protein